MKDFTPYTGRWVALIDELVVGVGQTAAEAQQAASYSRPRERVVLRFVDWPGEKPLPFSKLHDQLRPILAQEQGPIYLVGGAVRDALLGRVSHDLDYVVPSKAIQLAFRIADAISAPAYVLDRERDTGRVVLADHGTVLDIARFRGADLAADLSDRDFTINALAIPASAQTRLAVIDPTGGLEDLDRKRIRQTHKDAIFNDPVRALRAVRLSKQLGFEITPDTWEMATRAAPQLEAVSPERIRDELLKILVGPNPDEALADMETLGLLAVALPEIAKLNHYQQSPPHYENVLAHTRSTLRWLNFVENALISSEGADDQVSLSLRMALNPYRESLHQHLQRPIDGGLDGRTILHLGALFHDVGKGETFKKGEDDQIRFYNHAQVGEKIVAHRLHFLFMSNEAVSQVQRIVAGHMRPLYLLDAQGANLSRRAVYRFFRSSGINGLDICLLALADHLATYNGPGEGELWSTLLDLVGVLFNAYFERQEEAVKPKPYLNGRDLIDKFGLEPGPEIGRILRLIEENQAAGEITSLEEAHLFVRKQMA